MKVRDNEALKHQLVNNLFSFDINEAKHWNDVFGFNLFDWQESEDEDWEEEIENPKEKVKMKKVEAGVNICPKKSETVYPEIWGILKLSGLINQKIFETVYQNFQTVSKACTLILL